MVSRLEGSRKTKHHRQELYRRVSFPRPAVYLYRGLMNPGAQERFCLIELLVRVLSFCIPLNSKSYLPSTSCQTFLLSLFLSQTSQSVISKQLGLFSFYSSTPYAWSTSQSATADLNICEITDVY